MKSFLSTSFIVTCMILSSCGRPKLMQGSGTTGLLPFKQTNNKTERLETLRIYSLQEAMIRWNVVANGITIPGPVGGSFNFLWSEENEFPHPTFKGGSAEAYETFSGIFVRFFDSGDNLVYLKSRGLLDVPLLSVLGDGTVGISSSFRELATHFSSDDYSILISEPMRLELQRILRAM